MDDKTEDLEDFKWVAEGPGAARLADLMDDPRTSLQLATALRKELSISRAQLLVAQRELRRRAAGRFPFAEQMVWTSRSLEQATSWPLAQYKAARFPKGEEVTDLCCGLGGDLIALACRGPAYGIDRDEVCVYLAAFHAEKLASVLGKQIIGTSGAMLPQASTADCADIEDLCVRHDVAIHIDPDRRPGGRRSTQLQHHQPGAELLEQLTQHPAGLAIKLAPATDPDHPCLRTAELEWLGHGRDCQQLVAWFGPLAKSPGTRRATLVNADGTFNSLVSSDSNRDTSTMDSQPSFEVQTAQTVKRFIIEPNAAILAAGLAIELANKHTMQKLTNGGGYLTADDAEASPWWQRFEVMDVLPFREKRLRKWLKQHGVGHLEVKKRGVKIDPAVIQQRYSQAEGEPATLIIFNHGPQRIAALTKRCR